MGRYKLKKWRGDDKYSWAVYDKRSNSVVVGGLSKRSAKSHKRTLESKN